MPDPCPACKIILNGGFMATLAPALVKPDMDPAAHRAAIRLAEAARLHTEMFATVRLVLGNDHRGHFIGCEQAQLLVKWIVSGVPLDAAELMEQWIADVWLTIADLAAGKLPT